MNNENRISLTAVEHEVLALVAAGLTAKLVARELGLAPPTVQRHIEDCKRKLGAKNCAQLIAAAISGGYLPNPFPTQGRHWSERIV
jgi:DNA-binding CsgD family transcriptional regulator